MLPNSGQLRDWVRRRKSPSRESCGRTLVTYSQRLKRPTASVSFWSRTMPSLMPAGTDGSWSSVRPGKPRSISRRRYKVSKRGIQNGFARSSQPFVESLDDLVTYPSRFLYILCTFFFHARVCATCSYFSRETLLF